MTLQLLIYVLPALGPALAADSSEPNRVRSATVASTDGVRIAYDVRGQGEPTLVFIHCWACNRLFWRNQADVFARRYQVVTLDLAGHGESGTDRKRWSILGLSDDVRAVADALNLQRMILIGHSMGGPVTLEAAHRMRGRVLGVVLVDTLHDVNVTPSPKSIQSDAASLTSNFTGYFSDLSPLFTRNSDPSVRKWVEQQAMASNRAAVIALKLDTSNIVPKKLFRAAGVPIRAINAEPPLSVFTNVDENRKYADYDVILVHNAGHFLQLERPDAFNQALSQWVTSLSK